MPPQPRIKVIYKEELTRRAPAKMAQAGANWPLQVQGFFFPGNEDTVDQCALAVLKRALDEDGLVVTEPVRRRVRTLIGTQTITNSAIDVVFLAVFSPEEA